MSRCSNSSWSRSSPTRWDSSAVSASTAWALGAFMRPWRWHPDKHKLECLERIMRADVSLEQRALLWAFVDKHLHLDAEQDARLRGVLREHAEVMRETIVDFLDKRIGPYLSPELRQRIVECDDPMEIHRLIEEAYQESLRQGLVTAEEERPDWTVH